MNNLTAQAATYLLAVAVILSGYHDFKQKPWLLYLAAVIILAIQPIIGGHILLLVLALHLRSSRLKHKEFWYGLILAANIAWPLSLFRQWRFPSFNLTCLNFPNNEDVWRNFVGLWQNNLGWIITILIFAGFILSWRSTKRHALELMYLGQAGIIYLVYLITMSDSNANYLLYLSVLMLLPFILKTIYELLAKIWAAPIFARTALLIFLVFALAAAVYGFYIFNFVK